VQNYPVRPSHRRNLTVSGLEAILKECLGEAKVEGDAVVGAYGAISRIVVRPAGRDVSVEPTMNPQVPEEVARETIRRYNMFLEAATGYSSKERAKRLRKSAGEGGSGA